MDPDVVHHSALNAALVLRGFCDMTFSISHQFLQRRSFLRFHGKTKCVSVEKNENQDVNYFTISDSVWRKNETSKAGKLALRPTAQRARYSGSETLKRAKSSRHA